LRQDYGSYLPITSQLMGLAFMRYVWKIEPIATTTEGDLAASIAPTIQRYLDGDIGPSTPQPRPRRTPSAARSSPAQSRS
jgi:Tetracyclin repressor-like, C-terminal domain